MNIIRPLKELLALCDYSSFCVLSSTSNLCIKRSGAMSVDHAANVQVNASDVWKIARERGRGRWDA